MNTDNNTNPATPDLGQPHGYHLTMLKPLVYKIKTQQADINDSTLPPSTPDHVRIAGVYDQDKTGRYI